jgi:hypothetical protein
VDVAPSKLKNPTARFLIYGDGTKLFDSGTLRAETPAAHVDTDIEGLNVLRLIVTYEGLMPNTRIGRRLS